MNEILCLRCFARFDGREALYRCDESTVHPSPIEFGWKPKLGEHRPPRAVACPEDLSLTSLLICPDCKEPLPHYIGQAPQPILAIIGPQGSGKTVYLWSLLRRLRVDLARDEDPFGVAMFEDQPSARFYQDLTRTILERGAMPAPTQVARQRGGAFPSVVVRLIQRSERVVRTLAFFDHAGELIYTSEDVEYLRYLANASAILFLADSACAADADQRGLSAMRLAAHSLSNVARLIRRQWRWPEEKPLPHKAAVVLNKADETILTRPDFYPTFGAEDRDPSFWRRWGSAERAVVDEASANCEEEARRLGLDNLINIAHHNFDNTRVFAVSSLGYNPLKQPGRLPTPRPVGVENPLFWLLSK